MTQNGALRVLRIGAGRHGGNGADSRAGENACKKSMPEQIRLFVSSGLLMRTGSNPSARLISF
jgi:hypothetical protein